MRPQFGQLGQTHFNLFYTDRGNVKLLPGFPGPRCQFVVVSKAVVGEEIQRLCGFLEVKKFCPLLIANALSGLHFSLNINEQIDLAPVCL